MSRINIKDENNIPKLLKILEELSTKAIEIGVFGEGDSEILMIARVNEFGVSIDVTEKMRKYLHYIDIHLKKDTKQINIPERSFMRGGYDEYNKEFAKKGEKLLEKVINLQLSVDNFYNTLGKYIVGRIKKFLKDLKEPPKSPVTLKQNPNKTNPLIQTGELRRSITYKVVKV